MLQFDDDQQKKMKKIYLHYGTLNQVIHCVEELNELAVELAKYVDQMVESGNADLLGGTASEMIPSNFEHINEEIADVLICMNKLGPAVDWESVSEWVDFKLNRQLSRIRRSGD